MPPDQQRQHRESGVGSRRMCLVATSADHRTRRAVRVIAARRPSNGGWTSCQIKCPSTGLTKSPRPRRQTATPCRGARRSRPWRSARGPWRSARARRWRSRTRRWRRPAPSPTRRATSARTARRRPTSPTRTCSRSTRCSTATAQPNTSIQRLWTGALWAEGPAWSAEGRYLVFSDIPNNRQMRWIEDDGRVTRVPHAVEQQQRQHVRLPGPAALLRAPDAARRPLRARRLDHRARRLVQRQAPELAERRRPASRRQLLVHRSALRRPALRGRRRRRRRPEQRGRAHQEPRRPARGLRQR